ncbi:hypothetical protein AB0F25_18085 [Streptomyces wedmorensis]|uniref:hypothetical protein n=1 Tax=Streptomyces wedmorensis TaxID=43759 RepID=UPI003432E04A
MTSLRTLKAAAALATVTTALLLATTTAASAAEPAGLRGAVTAVADADLGTDTGTGEDDFGWQ